MSRRKTTGMGCIGMLLAAIIVAYASSECYVIQYDTCINPGTPCTATYNGQLCQGTVSSADSHNMCRQGSPGNRKCKYEGADRLCGYTCSIRVDDYFIEIYQAQTQKEPVLSGNGC